jgi:serine/threonine-protein kinase
LPEPALGLLVISAIPWAEVYVDGRPVGNTPIVDLPVPAGARRVRLIRDGFVPLTQDVQVGPGQTVRMTGIVLQELQR